MGSRAMPWVLVLGALWAWAVVAPGAVSADPQGGVLRSAHDLTAPRPVGYKAVLLRDGTYMLRAYDRSNGRFVSESGLFADDRLRARALDLRGRRFATRAEAQAAIPRHEASLAATARAPGVPPAVGQGRLARLKATALPALPLIAGTAIGMQVVGQMKEVGPQGVDLAQAAGVVASPRFLGGVVGGLLGGLGGAFVSGLAGPLGRPLVKAALILGGAGMGASMGSGTRIDWGRLLFTTGLTAVVAVPLMAANPLVAFVAMAAASVAADILYDLIMKFVKKKARPRVQLAAPPDPPVRDDAWKQGLPDQTDAGSQPPPGAAVVDAPGASAEPGRAIGYRQHPVGSGEDPVFADLPLTEGPAAKR